MPCMHKNGITGTKLLLCQEHFKVSFKSDEPNVKHLKTTFWDQIWHNLGACRPNKNGQHVRFSHQWAIFFQNSKNFIFGPFWALSPKLGQTRFFSFKNWAVTFEPLWTSTSCKRLDICNVTCIWSNCRIHPVLFWR